MDVHLSVITSQIQGIVMKKLSLFLAIFLLIPVSATADEYLSVSSVGVSCADNAPTVYSEPLQEGYLYLVEISGTYYANDQITSDARFNNRPPTSGDEWWDLVPKYTSYGEDLLEMFINGEAIDWDYEAAEWGNDNAFNEAHVYSVHVYGDGSGLELHIYDICSGNNSGGLNVAIIELTVDTDGDLIPDDEDICPNDAQNDADADGVCGDVDACLGTSEGDVVDADGCSIAQLCPCDSDWNNHGGYVSCVSQLADDFVDAGLLTPPEKGAIVSAAAQSDCGKKDKPKKGKK